MEVLGTEETVWPMEHVQAWSAPKVQFGGGQVVVIFMSSSSSEVLNIMKIPL